MVVQIVVILAIIAVLAAILILTNKKYRYSHAYLLSCAITKEKPPTQEIRDLVNNVLGRYPIEFYHSPDALCQGVEVWIAELGQKPQSHESTPMCAVVTVDIPTQPDPITLLGYEGTDPENPTGSAAYYSDAQSSDLLQGLHRSADPSNSLRHNGRGFLCYTQSPEKVGDLLHESFIDALKEELSESFEIVALRDKFMIVQAPFPRLKELLPHILKLHAAV